MFGMIDRPSDSSDVLRKDISANWFTQPFSFSDATSALPSLNYASANAAIANTFNHSLSGLAPPILDPAPICLPPMTAVNAMDQRPPMMSHIDSYDVGLYRHSISEQKNPMMLHNDQGYEVMYPSAVLPSRPKSMEDRSQPYDEQKPPLQPSPLYYDSSSYTNSHMWGTHVPQDAIDMSLQHMHPYEEGQSQPYQATAPTNAMPESKEINMTAQGRYSLPDEIISALQSLAAIRLDDLRAQGISLSHLPVHSDRIPSQTQSMNASPWDPTQNLYQTMANTAHNNSTMIGGNWAQPGLPYHKAQCWPGLAGQSGLMGSHVVDDSDRYRPTSIEDIKSRGYIRHIPMAGVQNRSRHKDMKKNTFLKASVTPLVCGLMDEGYDIRLGEKGRTLLKKEISLRFRAHSHLRDTCHKHVCRLKNANVIQLLAMSEITGCLPRCLEIANEYWKTYGARRADGVTDGELRRSLDEQDCSVTSNRSSLAPSEPKKRKRGRPKGPAATYASQPTKRIRAEKMSVPDVKIDGEADTVPSSKNDTRPNTSESTESWSLAMNTGIAPPRAQAIQPVDDEGAKIGGLLELEYLIDYSSSKIS